MLDGLHGAGIEVVSPAFMNTRALDTGARVLPRPQRVSEPRDRGLEAEAVAFDKAEEAARRRHLAEQVDALTEQIEELEARLKGVNDDEERLRLERRVTASGAARERLSRQLDEADGRLASS
jgi:predicted  nucleic acid-binding Zn-ribbon protein